jgi:hypothetical protein
MTDHLRRKFAIANCRRCVWELTRYARAGLFVEELASELQWCREEFAIAAVEVRGGYS